MLIYKSRFLVRGEVWYDQEPDPRPVDWILYRQRSRLVPGTRWRYFYTLLIDLNQTPEALLRQMSTSTASKVRRARDKDGILCECLKLDAAGIEQFIHVYNQFAATKGLDALDRSELDGLAADRLLELSVARNRAGESLVFHAYYRDPDWSCFLYSASLHRTFCDSATRNAIGRANVLLFWNGFLRHKAEGTKCFDFGGWYPGNTDQQLLGINRFKAGFGGRLVRKYCCERILSVRGWVLLTTARILGRIRGSDPALMSEPVNPAHPPGGAQEIPVASCQFRSGNELQVRALNHERMTEARVQAPGSDAG
jgi:hypothetical protein